MKKYDVAAMGELLIDFTQNGYSDQGNPYILLHLYDNYPTHELVTDRFCHHE
jgi:hypothetical protein